MCNKDEEYNEATRHASINTYNEEKSKYGLWILLNIALFMILFIIGYYGYEYFKSKEGKHSYPYVTNVMGVSHTYDEEKSSDEQMSLVNMLNHTDVDRVIEDSAKENLVDAMNGIVNASTVKNDSDYMKALSSEMGEGSDFNK